MKRVKDLRFALVRDVEAPKRAHPHDAGLDFSIPRIFPLDVFLDKNPTLCRDNYSSDGIVLHPGERVLIPSGVHVEVPEGMALIAMNKSGISSKRGLVPAAAVVDSGYQGEVHINLINTSNVDVRVKFGEKIIQFIMFPIVPCGTEEVLSLAELYPQDTVRMTGGFGSTGT